MGRSTDSRIALRLLRGLENGGLGAHAAADLAEELDPVLIHSIIRFLRESYPASEPAATAVLDRVVAMTRANPSLVRLAKEGERDAIAGWFASEYNFAEFRGRGEAMLELVIDKLES